MAAKINELRRILKQKFPIRRLEDHLKSAHYSITVNDSDELNKLQLFLAKKSNYQKKAISIISDCLQKDIIRIDDGDLYESFSEWLTLEESLYYTNSKFSSQQDNQVIYQLQNGDEIVINEERDLLASKGTTGFRTWEAALFLYYYLTAINPGLINENDVTSALELGCGTGFLGIFLAKMMKNTCFKLTDGSDLVVEKCVSNVRANSLDHTHVQVEQLLWGENEFENSKNAFYDLIFGADVTFDSTYIPALVDTITAKLKPKGTCIISATIRNEETIATLYDCVEKLGPKWKLEKCFTLPSSFCVDVTDESTKNHRDTFIKKVWFEDLLADIHIYKISQAN